MGPIDRGPQSLLPAHRGARAPGQEAEAVVKTIDDFVERQGSHTCGGKFDRQRHSVKATKESVTVSALLGSPRNRAGLDGPGR